MATITIDGREMAAEPGETVLEVARRAGIEIPTLCHHPAIEPASVCRMCVVEAAPDGRSKVVTSCSYPARDGLVVETETERVRRVRRVALEFFLARSPGSKVLHELAEKLGVGEPRVTLSEEEQSKEGCILCGRCVRMCAEQMTAKAIGFRGRGEKRSIGTPFDVKSDVCRLCGGCIYVCPACTLRCTYNEPEKAICNACANLSPPCVEKDRFGDMMCYMDPCVACEIEKD